MTSAEATLVRTGRILRKIALSLCIGIPAYFITNVLSGDSKVFGVVLSVFLGGVTLVVQFLLDFENRLTTVEQAQREQSQALQADVHTFLGQARGLLAGTEAAQKAHAQAIENQVRVGFSKINEATELFGLLEASVLESAEVIQLVRHSTQIKPTAPPLIFKLARSEIVRTAELLKELSEGGTAIYEGEDRDWMLALARNVQNRIDATSLTTVDAGGRGQMDGGLWYSDLGQRYLEAQRAAIERGVGVRRVFIVNRPDLLDDDHFLGACRQQQDMGIEVRLLPSSTVPNTRRSSLFDFVLFDEAVSYEVTPTSSIEGAPPLFVNTRLELRASRIQDRIGRFQDLWATARELDA